MFQNNRHYGCETEDNFAGVKNNEAVEKIISKASKSRYVVRNE